MPAAMGRPKKHVKASRDNGSMAPNKGKIKSEPKAILKEVYVRNGASLDITFEKVMRAKLHKNNKYYDEWRVEQRVARAAQMVRAALLPGKQLEGDGVKRLAEPEARAYLNAFEAATGATA